MIAATSAEGARVLSCGNGEIAAGAVCAHTHLYSGLARYGMPAASPSPQNFVQILERVWWRLDRALDAETLRAAAKDYVARALLAGTTALVDHHESPFLIEGSLADSSRGVRATRHARAALLRGDRAQFRTRRSRARPRRVPLHSSVAIDTRHGRACTRALRSPTTPCARPALSRANSRPSCMCMSPRTKPMSMTRGRAVSTDRWSG